MELILKLIEKLIELLKVRKKQNRALFEDHIEPIYSMVRKVTDDYLQLFGQTRKQLADDSISLSTIHKTLVSRRKKLELVRKELTKYSRSTWDFHSNDQIKEFAYLCWRLIVIHPKSIQSYGSLSAGITQATSLIGEIETAMKMKDPYPRDDLVLITDEYIERTKKIWSDITDIYIVLRTKMLK